MIRLTLPKFTYVIVFIVVQIAIMQAEIGAML